MHLQNSPNPLKESTFHTHKPDEIEVLRQPEDKMQQLQDELMCNIKLEEDSKRIMRVEDNWTDEVTS